MAEWKKVVVSGSTANLANLQVDGLSSGVVTGAAGNLSTTAINGSGNIVATTGGTGLVMTGSFTGSFTGDGSNLTGVQASTLANNLQDGNGIADFTFNGSSAVTISVDSGSLAGAGLGTNNSTLTVNVDDTGIEINSDTLRLKDDGVTAAKLDDVFTNGGGVAGAFGSTTQIPKVTIDGQGRITTASLVSVATNLTIGADDGSNDTVDLLSDTLTFTGDTGITTTVSNNDISIDLDDVFTDGGGVAGTFGSTTAVPKLTINAQGQITTASLETIATSFDIAADSGTNDTVNGGETLTFAGGTGVSTTVTNNNIAIDIASGIVSASAFASPSQGSVRATINGVQTDVDTGLQTTDSPTFVGITATGNALIQGDLTVQGTTTTLQTTNTAITDKFILLNSGSANPDEGGIIIDEGSGTGHGLIYDAGDGRFGVNQSVDSTSSTANSEAYVALVIDEDNVAHDVNDAEYQKRGNMKVDSSDDIFIYV